MPQAGALWFEISADDKATSVLAKANAEFNKYRESVLGINEEVASSAREQTRSITRYNSEVKKASGITRNLGRSATSWTRAAKGATTGIKAFDSFGDILNVLDTATDNFVGKLGGLGIATAGMYSFATAALEVARSVEITALRTEWISDALNYGTVSTEEAAAAAGEFRDQLKNMSPLMTRNVSELVRMGYQVQWVTENYKQLNEIAILAGESVTDITRTLGSTDMNDLVSLGIDTNYARDMQAYAAALQIRQEYFAEHGRFMDKEVALAQARTELYKEELDAYAANMEEAGGTYEVAVERFNQAMSKFKNVVGKIYNIAVAPIIGIGEAILDMISSNPILTYATAFGAVGSALVVLATTGLPMVIGGFNKVYGGIQSAISAVTAFKSTLNMTKTAELMGELNRLGDGTIRNVIAELAVRRNINVTEAKESVLSAQNVALEKTHLELIEKLRNNTTAILLLEKERLGLGKANLSASLAENLLGKDSIEGVVSSLGGVQSKLKGVSRKGILESVKGMLHGSGMKGMLSTLRLIPAALTAIIPAIGGVVAAALPALGSLVAAAAPVLAVIAAITGAIFLVKKAYDTNFAGFADLIGEIGNAIGEVWGAFIEPFQEVFSGDGGVMETISEIFGIIEELVRPILDDLVDFIKFITPALKVIARVVGTVLVQPFKLLFTIVKGITDAISKIVDYFSGNTENKVVNTTQSYGRKITAGYTDITGKGVVVTGSPSTVTGGVGVGNGFVSYTAARNQNLASNGTSAMVASNLNGTYASSGGSTSINVSVNGLDVNSTINTNNNVDAKKIESYIHSNEFQKEFGNSITDQLARMFSAMM